MIGTPQQRPPSYDKAVALVLQGGGALGSYQAGVYEALSHSAYLPDWVAGISIGAINAAIIVGNPPEQRVDQLRGFWESVTEPTAAWPDGLDGVLATWQQQASAQSALLFGQPGFFKPRAAHEWFLNPAPLSYYNTDALKGTLERFVDFERINHSSETRFSVGAVNVRTGRFAYFDNRQVVIRPEHVMASGALPPGFPPVEIDGEFYWDGGLVSNTPMEYVLDHYPRESRLTFQIDVFQGFGQIPVTLEQVNEREKDIRYSSRTRASTTAFAHKHEVRFAIEELLKLLPEDIAQSEQAKRLESFSCVTEMDIVQLIYRPFSPQGASKDFEFSRSTMNARWAQGLSDTNLTLQASPWLKPAPTHLGVRLFDVIHDQLIAQNKSKRKDAADWPDSSAAAVAEGTACSFHGQTRL